MFLSIVYATLFYVATLILVFGTFYKIISYKRTPVILPIPTMSAPKTKIGVFFRILGEVFLFVNLFRANKLIWFFSWLFHFGFLLVLLSHLFLLQNQVWHWVILLKTFAIYPVFIMLFGLFGLLLIKFVIARIRYISTLSDYLMLLFFIMIGLTGVMMKYWLPVNIILVKNFVLGLVFFEINPIPDDLIFLTHISLVIFLMIIFPVSKLVHSFGIFLSPTINQSDNLNKTIKK